MVILILGQAYITIGYAYIDDSPAVSYLLTSHVIQE